MTKEQQQTFDRLTKYYQENFELLTLIDTDDIKKYHFRNSKDNNLSQIWTIIDGVLIVNGDAGDSIYNIGTLKTLEDIAHRDLYSFRKKCLADRDGYRQEKFDHETMINSYYKCVIDYFDEEEFEEVDTVDNLKDKIKIIEKILQKKNDNDWFEIPLDFDGEHDAVEWFRDNDEIVGEEWYHEIVFNKMTDTPIRHLTGLKVGVEMLNNKK